MAHTHKQLNGQRRKTATKRDTQNNHKQTKARAKHPQNMTNHTRYNNKTIHKMRNSWVEAVVPVCWPREDKGLKNLRIRRKNKQTFLFLSFLKQVIFFFFNFHSNPSYDTKPNLTLKTFTLFLANHFLPPPSTYLLQATLFPPSSPLPLHPSPSSS